MNEQIKRILEDEGIERFAALAYADVREVKPHILGKDGFRPKSVLMFLLPYYTGETKNISRYAASLDYHMAIREITGRIIDRLNDLFPGAVFRGYGDHSPIDERHAALIGGLGICGDNGLLIDKKYGSYVFIADILTDLPPEAVGAVPPATPDTCEHCGACRRACPTGILRSEGETCLSAITQQKKDLTKEEVALMKKYHTVWGCDECQCHCPHNRIPVPTPISFFYREKITELTLDGLNAMSDEEFSRRAFAWRGRAVVRRNLLLVGDSREK